MRLTGKCAYQLRGCSSMERSVLYTFAIYTITNWNSQKNSHNAENRNPTELRLFFGLRPYYFSADEIIKPEVGKHAKLKTHVYARNEDSSEFISYRDYLDQNSGIIVSFTPGVKFNCVDLL